MDINKAIAESIINIYVVFKSGTVWYLNHNNMDKMEQKNISTKNMLLKSLFLEKTIKIMMAVTMSITTKNIELVPALTPPIKSSSFPVPFIKLRSYIYSSLFVMLEINIPTKIITSKIVPIPVI